jgi:aspartate dehydrogenase
MVRVGLVGCGTIGTQVALAVQRRYAHVARIVALHDVDLRKAQALRRRLHPAPALESLPGVIRKSRFVIEAASVDAVRDVVLRAHRGHRDVLVMSVGGLLERRLWRKVAARSRGRVYVPSGALAGLDGVKALAVGRIRSLRLTTRKPPKAFASSPYVRRLGLRLSQARRPRVLFEGTPRAVVRAFPQNTNVAAALALAGGKGGMRARIRVVADPTIHVNVHELEAVGDCGRIACRFESRPSANPKTSELAVRSAVAALGRLFEPIAIGT